MERHLYTDLQAPKISSLDVLIDPETESIFKSKPQSLLNEIFNNESDRVFLLEKTGFNMSMQIQLWINLYSSAIKENTNLDETKDVLISKTIQDVVGFYFEYLSKQDIFPIKVEFRENEIGEKTVYASHYNQTLESLALPEERDGALYEGIKKAVEILTTSDPETIVFLTSPDGWSGLGHRYPDSQTYVYWINENGDLDALTIRTDINLQSNERLVQKVDSSKDTKERIKNVVRSPRSIKANSYEKVLDLIEESSGKSFDKQRKEIRDRERLFQLNDEATLIVQSLKESLTKNISHLDKNSIKIFVKTVGKAILDLSILSGNKDKSSDVYRTKVYDINHFENNSISPIIYYAELERVQRINGCNGGGQMTTAGSFGREQIQIESSGVKYVKNCGNCNVSINAFIPPGYECPSCHGIFLGC